MTIWEQIFEAYPELADSKPSAYSSIIIRNDSDGVGDYIEKWEYLKPMPDGLTLGKPTA